MTKTTIHQRAGIILSVLAAFCLLLTGCTLPFEESSVLTTPSQEVEPGQETVPVRKEEITSPGAIPEGRLVSVEDVGSYVTLGEYQGLRLMASGVTEEVVDREIERRLLADSSTMKGDTALQTGDKAVISYVADVGFDALEGGQVSGYILQIGREEMLPGFEEALIGMTTGQTRRFSLTCPQTEAWGALAGTDISFTVTLSSFTRPAELTDEWAQAAGSENVQAYREAVRSQLELETPDEEEKELRAIAWQGIMDRSMVISVPEADLAAALAQYDRMVDAYALQAGMDRETYILSQGLTMEEYQSQANLYANERVKQNLVVQGILDEQGFTLTDEVSQRILAEITAAAGYEDPAAMIEAYGRQEVEASVALERVLDFCMESSAQEGMTDQTES